MIAGYLDDLYVDPSTRGSGAVEALFAEINRHRARTELVGRALDDCRRQLPRSRAVYDKLATARHGSPTT